MDVNQQSKRIGGRVRIGGYHHGTGHVRAEITESNGIEVRYERNADSPELMSSTFDEAESVAALLRDLTRIIRYSSGVGGPEVA